MWGGGITGRRGAEQRAQHAALSYRYLQREWPALCHSPEEHAQLRHWGLRLELTEPPPDLMPGLSAVVSIRKKE